MVKLYVDINEVLNDERVSDIMETLMTSPESAKATNELIRRIVELSNSHIWGTLILLQQKEENGQ